MIKHLFSLKRAGAALLALTMMASISLAHGGHGKHRHGKKKAKVHHKVKHRA